MKHKQHSFLYFMILSILLLCIACDNVSAVSSQQFHEIVNSKNISSEIIGTWSVKSFGGDFGFIGSCVTSDLSSATYEFKSDGTGFYTKVKSSGETVIEPFTYIVKADGRVESMDGDLLTEIKISNGTMYIYSDTLNTIVVLAKD